MNNFIHLENSIAFSERVLVESVIETNDSYICTVKNELKDRPTHNIVVGDILRCERISNASFLCVVNVVSGNDITIKKNELQGKGRPYFGDFLIRFGSIDNTKRKGVLTLEQFGDSIASLMVYDDLNTLSLTDKITVKIGYLDGIYDENLGLISGYGAYLKNSFVSGILHAKEGSNMYTKDEINDLIDNLTITNPNGGNNNGNNFKITDWVRGVYVGEKYVFYGGSIYFLPKGITATRDDEPKFSEKWIQKITLSSENELTPFLKSLGLLNGKYLTTSGNKIWSGNSDMWDGLYRASYINQPVRTFDDVVFNVVNATTALNSPLGQIDVVNSDFVNVTEKVTTKLLNATTSITSPLGLIDTIRTTEISSPTFVPGFTGEGFKLAKDANDDYVLELDRLSVRKDFSVYELVVNKIRGTNGSLWVSDAVEITDATPEGSNYRCTIDTDSNTMTVPFLVDDIVRCQVFNGTGMKYYTALVIEVDLVNSTFVLQILEGASVPSGKDNLVRIGSTTNVSRQGALYLTSSDSGSPYLDVVDKVTSASLAGKMKVRLGKLDGIIDPQLGALSGYGIYAQNGYFKGKIILDSSGSNVYTKSETNTYVNNTSASISHGYYELSKQYTDSEVSQAIIDANQFTTDAINAINIGGRNIVLKSKGEYGSEVSLRLSQQPKTGDVITVSATGKNNGRLYLYHNDGNGWSFIKMEFNNTEWERKIYTVTIPATDDANLPMDGTHPYLLAINWGVNGANSSSLMKEIKIEFAEKASDWTPAPEDIENALEVFKTETNTRFEVVETGLTSKVEQTDFNALNQTVANHTTLIQQNADAIALRATKTEFDALTNTVTGIEGRVTSAEAELVVQADEIATKVTQTQVDVSIGNIKIGGRNVLRNTRNDIKFNPNNDGLGYKEVFPEFTRFTCDPDKYISLYGYNTNGWTVYDSNAKYAMSIYLRHPYSTPIDIRFNTYNVSNIPPNVWNRIEIYNNEFIDLNSGWLGLYTTVPVQIDLKFIQVEEGNKVTDWRPAPEDIESRVTLNETTISQKADRIELTALSSTVDSLGNTVASNTAQIEINSNAITSKVWTADITTAINGLSLGGVNLVRNSDEVKYSNGYLVAQYRLSEDIIFGQEYVVTIWGSSDNNGYFGLWDGAGSAGGWQIWRVSEGLYRGNFIPDTWVGDKNHISIYQQPYTTNNGAQILKIQLEKGNKGTDWSPSPFDLNAKVNDLTIRMSSAESEIIQTSTAISQKVWTTDIETSINKIQIGTRNLLRYSNTLEVFALYGVTGAVSNKSAPEQLSKQIIRLEDIVRDGSAGDAVFYIPTANNPKILDRASIVGQEVVFSFRARANGNFIMDFGGGTRIGESDIDTNWRTYAYRIIIIDSGNWHFGVAGSGLQWMEFTGFKVELGNKYSSWTLNPDDEELGGTNMYSNRITNIEAYDGAAELVKNHPNSPNGFIVTGSPSHNGTVRILNVIDSNDWWTVSGWVRSTQGVNVPFLIDIADNTISQTFYSNGNNWTYFEYSSYIQNYSAGVYSFVDFGGLNHLYYEFKDIKIEKGNKATAWSPSPKDIDQQFSDVNTRITSAETAITQTNTNITLSASKTEGYLKQSLNIDYANGKNKWLFNKYDYPNVNGGTAPKLEMIANLTSDYTKLVPDATNLLIDIADGYIGHYRCMAFVSSNIVISFSCTHDDGMTAYVNGVINYESSVYIAGAVVQLNLKTGWNTIDLLNMEGAGGDGIYDISNPISNQVGSMYAVTSGAMTQSTVKGLDKNTYDGEFERGLELWSNHGAFNATSIIPPTCRIVPDIGINGGNVWRTEGGEGWLYSLKPIPVVRGHRYRLTVRYCVRQHALSGASPTYCGFAQYYPDGSTPTNLGLNYFVFTGENLPADNLNTWYTKSAEYQMNLTGYNSDIAYIKVAMGFNYGGHNAIIDCDSLILEDITQEWESRTYTNSQITIVNDAITATSTRVDNLSGRMETAEFKLQPDQINLTVSEQVRVSTDKTSQLVDLRSLDPNTSYPVCIVLPGNGKRIRITATRSLDSGSGVPPYATHGAGFSLSIIWTTNGAGWGTQPRIENIEKSMVTFVNDSRGWGSVQQNTMASHEIFYLRGGSLYTVTMEGNSNPNDIILYSSGYYWESSPVYTYSAPIIPHTSVLMPEVSYQTKADIQAGITITSNAINIYGQSLTLTGAVTFESLDTGTQNKVNAEVGGRNYYNKLSQIAEGGGAHTLVKTPTGFNVNGVNANNAYVRIGYVVTENGWWTVSFEHRIDYPGYPLWVDICDIGGINDPNSRFDFPDGNWKKVVYTAYVNNYSESVYNFVDIWGLTAQTHYFRNFKVEKGQKATDWSPVDEWIYSTTTEINGAMIRTGTITADKINADTLIARQVKTSEAANRMTINENNDNLIRVRHVNGTIGIEMGLIGSKPVLIFYNDVGAKLWEGGMDGIVYVNNVPESWQNYGNFHYLDPTRVDVSDPMQNQDRMNIETYFYNIHTWFSPSVVYKHKWWGAGGAEEWTPVLNVTHTIHHYNAGNNAQTAQNIQYNGYHTSEVKSTSNFVVDGWYIRILPIKNRVDDNTFRFDISGGTNGIWIYEALLFEGGQLTQSAYTAYVYGDGDEFGNNPFRPWGI